MRKTRRPLAALALLALIAMIVAGYANASAKTGGDRSRGAPATHEAALKFAQCMRDNGVKNFPDPAGSGEFTIDGVVNGSSLDPNSASWKKAIGACKDLEPAGFMGYKRSAQEQVQVLAFAQCMRDNGFADFPDPTDKGPIIDTSKMPGAPSARSIPGFQGAIETCRDLLPRLEA